MAPATESRAAPATKSSRSATPARRLHGRAPGAPPARISSPRPGGRRAAGSRVAGPERNPPASMSAREATRSPAIGRAKCCRAQRWEGVARSVQAAPTSGRRHDQCGGSVRPARIPSAKRPSPPSSALDWVPSRGSLLHVEPIWSGEGGAARCERVSAVLGAAALTQAPRYGESGDCSSAELAPMAVMPSNPSIRAFLLQTE